VFTLQDDVLTDEHHVNRGTYTALHRPLKKLEAPTKTTTHGKEEEAYEDAWTEEMVTPSDVKKANQKRLDTLQQRLDTLQQEADAKKHAQKEQLRKIKEAAKQMCKKNQEYRLTNMENMTNVMASQDIREVIFPNLSTAIAQIFRLVCKETVKEFPYISPFSIYRESELYTTVYARELGIYPKSAGRRQRSFKQNNQRFQFF
jgi:hypothetical protein